MSDDPKHFSRDFPALPSTSRRRCSEEEEETLTLRKPLHTYGKPHPVTKGKQMEGNEKGTAKTQILRSGTTEDNTGDGNSQPIAGACSMNEEGIETKSTVQSLRLLPTQPRPVVSPGNTEGAGLTTTAENSQPNKGGIIVAHTTTQNPIPVVPEGNIVDACPATDDRNPGFPVGNILGHPKPTSGFPHLLRVVVPSTAQNPQSKFTLTQSRPDIPSTTGPLNSLTHPTFTQDPQRGRFQLPAGPSIVPTIQGSSKVSLNKGLPNPSSTQVPLGFPFTSMPECTPGYPAMKFRNWIPSRREVPAHMSYDQHSYAHPHFHPIKIKREQRSSFRPKMHLHLQYDSTKNNLQSSCHTTGPIPFDSVNVEFTFSDSNLGCDPHHHFHDEIIFHPGSVSCAGPVDYSHPRQPNSVSVGFAAKENKTYDKPLSGNSVSQPQQNSQFPVAIGNPPPHVDGVNNQPLHPSSYGHNNSNLIRPVSFHLYPHHEQCKTAKGSMSTGMDCSSTMQNAKGEQLDIEVPNHPKTAEYTLYEDISPVEDETEDDEENEN